MDGQTDGILISISHVCMPITVLIRVKTGKVTEFIFGIDDINKTHNLCLSITKNVDYFIMLRNCIAVFAVAESIDVCECFLY